MDSVRTVSPATCLGCGCTCDDIRLVVNADRIVEAGNACSLGLQWFGDGVVPARASVDGRDVTLDEAIERAAALLALSARPLVYLAPELTCEAQREGVAIADALRARVDSVTSATVRASVLAQQERGRTSATLGEIRNRSDLLVFWGVDPSHRYPRYWSRYAPEPSGVHVPGGRGARTVVAVDVGAARGPDDADRREAVAPEREVALLTAAADVVARGSRLTPDATDGERIGTDVVAGVSRTIWRMASSLSSTLLSGRYVTIVADAEPDDLVPDRDAGRAAALIALAQALNGPTRCALSLLRGGGNRSGADAVLTWQTGYPMAVDFSRGSPRYRPYESADAAADAFDAVLVLGAEAQLPARVAAALRQTPHAIVGPRASGAEGALVAIDTGVAGIHEAGTVFRMDDVTVPVHRPVEGPPAAADVLRRLRAALVRQG